MTFSIIGIDKKNKEIGIACYSKAFAVGAMVPKVKFGKGAVVTQSYPNVLYKEEGICLMQKFNLKEVIKKMIKKDKNKDLRQVILMNSKGKSIGFTGKKNISWAGHLIGKNFICAGNMLIGEEVLIAMKDSFEKSKGNLTERLIKSLFVAEKVGGDKRKIKYNSSFIIVEKKSHGIFGLDDRYIDIRVDYSEDSIRDLKKLLKIRKKEEKEYSLKSKFGEN